MKTKYIIYHSYSNAIKNKLHDSYEQFILNNDRVVHESLSCLKMKVRNEVDRLNEMHPRCKPIEVHFTGFRAEETISIDTNTGIKAQLLQIKHN